MDLLEQCVAYASANGKTAVGMAEARLVAERMVGMPLDMEERLSTLREQVTERGLLTDADLNILANRLQVSLRGLDLRAVRPNAVALLIGKAADNSEALAEVIASSLFGGPERVVTIDFGRFTEPHHISSLIGAPPGYVGYQDSLPLHRVAQMPWCVLRCENIGECHPQVLQLLTQGLENGVFTDAQDKKYYLSDAVVLLTAGVQVETHRAVGFRQAAEHDQGRDVCDAAERELGAELVAQADLICSDVVDAERARERWLQKRLLSSLCDRYRKQGVEVSWDETLVDWLVKQQTTRAQQRDWERLVDDRLSPLLIPHIPAHRGKELTSLVIKCDGDTLKVEKQPLQSEPAAQPLSTQP